MLRILGFVACAGCVVLWWILLYANPYGRNGLTGWTYLAAWMMIACACLGALASLKARIVWMYVLFAVSFFPIGVYLAGTPGIFKWIGGFDLCFFFSAVSLHARSRAQTRACRRATLRRES